MLFRDVIELIDERTGEDEWGDPVPVITKREVMANRKSVRQSEFYQAVQAGLRPEIMFEIRSVEYQGELELEHGGKKYKVLRTYDKGEMTEIVCEWVRP